MGSESRGTAVDVQCRAWYLATAGLRRWLMVLCLVAVPLVSSAGVFISVNFAPPPLPVYAQPLIPGPGYIWVPGYWAYGGGGYFWVPGTWVLPPYAGALWTPGYWGWADDAYVFHVGYWGPRVGFYGGINYGFGYTGFGYFGGYWHGGAFYYNRSVNNIRTTTIIHVYNRTVINDTVINRVSYNGGAGGVMARPTEEQLLAAREPHVAPTQAQLRQVHAASQQRSLRAAFNHGIPAIAATRRPGVFQGRDVVRARPTGNDMGRGARAMTPYARPRPQDARRYEEPHPAPERAYGPTPRAAHVNPVRPMRRTAPTRRHEPDPRCCGGFRSR